MGPSLGACIVGGGAAIFLLAGLWLTWSAFRDLVLQRASRHWPSIQGDVVSATIRDMPTTTSRGETQTSYLPKIEYAYSVRGRRYTASRIAFGGQRMLPSREEADVVTNKYPEGGHVQVYYDPASPGTAVLEPAHVRNTFPWLFAGVLFFGGGIFLSLFAYLLATRPPS